MRRTWKKLATLLLAGAVLVSTTACGGGETSGKQKDMENKVLRVLNWGNTEEEKIAMCRAVTNAGADFIKTSTGFGTAGALLSDIGLFQANIGENVKIKAAGGVRTLEDLKNYVEAGCSRVGASSVVKQVAELQK